LGKLIHLLKCGETEWEANKKSLAGTQRWKMREKEGDQNVDKEREEARR
jgi:hypothetical protein